MKFQFDWNYVASGAPYVTISNSGIAFNNISISLLNNPDNILIGFDKNNLTIGVKEYKGEEGVKSYEFAKKERSGWIRIGCKDFIKHLSLLTGISYKKAVKYIAKYDETAGILYVNVSSENIVE